MKQVNRIAILLSLILAFAAVLFIFGSGDGNTTPSSINTKGLGIAAYAELLRRNNIPVIINRSPVIKLSSQDVLVTIEDNARYYDLFDPENPDAQESDDEEFSRAQPSQLKASIEQHLAKGGRVLHLVMPSSSNSLRPAALSTQCSTPDKKTKFAITLPEKSYLLEPEDQNDNLPIVISGKDFLIHIADDSGGTKLEVADATFLRNRFIALTDNAKLGIWIARRYLPPGGKYVIAEASVGNQESRTALDEIGKWATTAFWQSLFVLAMVVYTLNRRFGVVSREITKVRGAKELMDAMSLTLQRAHRRDHALLILRSNAIDRVRRAYRLSAGLSENDVVSRMQPDAQAIMSTILRVQGQAVPASQAIALARSLESFLKEIELQVKASRAPSTSG